MVSFAAKFAGNLKTADQKITRAVPNLLALPHVERTYWRGMSIYSQEDAITHIFVVLKGRVKVLRSSPEGQQKIVSIRYRGDMFGELALAGLDHEPSRSDEAVALETTRVALIRLGDFWQTARRDSALMQNTLHYLSARLAEAHRQIESLVFDNNHKRLGRALLELANEAARADEPSVRLTHEELAELIGSTREVVTGMMIEFRQMGLIDYKRGDIRPNLQRLTDFVRE